MRSYRQYCAAARALDLVGSRWTLLVLRELLLGPRRYSQLRAALPGLTTNLLAARLRAMVAEGLIRRAGGAYELAPDGAALEPVLLELARWGMRTMDGPRRGERVDVGWMLLACKLWYRGGADVEVELTIDGRTFELRLLRDQLLIQERRATHPAVAATLTLAAFLALGNRTRSITALRRAGLLHLTGDARAFTRAIAALRPPRRGMVRPTTP